MARILIIDDQKIPRVTTSKILAEAGHEVETAGSGPEGLKLAEEWSPDVIVLDVHMPEMDGFEVVKRLKADPKTEPVPVIFLTGTSSSDTLVARGLDLGAYDFLTKGCSREELLARVGAMARIKRSSDEMSAIARISETLIQSLDPDDLTQLFLEQVREIFRADAAFISYSALGESRSSLTAVGVDESDPLLDTLPGFIVERLDGEKVDFTLLEMRHFEGPIGAFVRRHDLRSAAGARLRNDDRPATVLAVFSQRPSGFRRDSDAPLLQLLAGQVNIALDNATLHTRTRKQAEELERSVDERSRFFASMSHELRTPINAVIGYTQLLQESAYGGLEESQLKAVDRIERSAQHLLELINDVLDISKIEAGKMDVHPEETELGSLVRDTATSLQLQAERKGLALHIDAPEEVRVETDPSRVRQIVLNLLANAVKFTEVGEIRVSVEDTTAEAAGEDAVAVKVTDTGPGIDPDHLERIFEEFEQSGSAPGGTGLGLPISRRLAKLLGGSLSVRSTPGEGSAFTLMLPRKLSVASQPTAGATQSA